MRVSVHLTFIWLPYTGRMSIRQILQSTGRSAFALATALSLLSLQAHAATTLSASTAKGVLEMEDGSESIAEGAVKPPKSLAEAKRVGKDWPALRTQLRSQGISEKDVANLDRAVLSLQAATPGMDVRRLANEVTGALAPLFAFIRGETVPVEMHTLDYLGRSLQMDGKEGSWGRADVDSAAQVKAWERLRPRVMAANEGPPIAAEYDACVKSVGKASAAKDGAALTAAAIHCNDIGDRVSNLF
jgi:hypothetical protein